MDIALQIVQNKAEKIVWDKRDGSQRTLDKSDICPISGKWLIPASCTEEEPPKVEEGNIVSFQNGKWITEKTEEQIEKEETQKYKPVVKSIKEEIEELKSQIKELKFELKLLKEGDNNGLKTDI